MFKVKNKDTGANGIVLVFLLLTFNIFSIVNFE